MYFRRLMVAGVVIVLGLTISLAMLHGEPATGGNTNPPGPHYLAVLSTDKPIYRDGEKVYLRAVVLGADDHRPLPDNQMVYAVLQIKGPKGEILFNTAAQSEQSVAGLVWDVPADAAGGQYKAMVSFPSNGYPPA